MYKNEGSNTPLSTPITSASAAPKKKQKQQYGDRGSCLHFLTNSFHGVLGASSFTVTVAAWISNSLVLTLFSVLTTTVLSIHSSWYMLEQSPRQSTILDCQLELRSGSTAKSKNDKNNFVRLWIVAPHRGAFHRTSIIMQYTNTRILLLLQRKYWHDASASARSTSGVLLWGLATLMCLRINFRPWEFSKDSGAVVPSERQSLQSLLPPTTPTPTPTKRSKRPSSHSHPSGGTETPIVSSCP